MTHLSLTAFIFLVSLSLLAPAFSATAKLTPGSTVVVTPKPGDGVARRNPVTVHLPQTTPYAKGSANEQLYLKGFSLGFLDSVNGRFV
jgi:hypothetical protein